MPGLLTVRFPAFLVCFFTKRVTDHDVIYKEFHFDAVLLLIVVYLCITNPPNMLKILGLLVS